jgi:predicted transcriptional regulator
MKTAQRARPNPFGVRLDNETIDLLRRLVKIEERSVGVIFRRALRAYVQQEYPNGVPEAA